MRHAGLFGRIFCGLEVIPQIFKKICARLRERGGTWRGINRTTDVTGLFCLSFGELGFKKFFKTRVGSAGGADKSWGPTFFSGSRKSGRKSDFFRAGHAPSRATRQHHRTICTNREKPPKRQNSPGPFWTLSQSARFCAIGPVNRQLFFHFL